MIATLLVSMTLAGQYGQAPFVPRDSDCAAVVALMNQERQRAGLGPLRPNLTLSNAADVQCWDNVRAGVLKHHGSDGSSPDARARRAGFRGGRTGENAAWNYRSPERVVAGWMSSSGHRRAIMHPDHREVGIACENGSNGPYWFACFGGP